MNHSASSELRLQQLVQRLQPIVPVKIILFGSAARDQADAQSDLDVKLDGNSLIETAEREGRVLYERSAA